MNYKRLALALAIVTFIVFGTAPIYIIWCWWFFGHFLGLTRVQPSGDIWLSEGFSFLGIPFFFLSFVPIVIVSCHYFNDDWNFWDALQRKFPAKTPKQLAEPSQSDWR